MLMKKASLICDCLTNFLCPTAINGPEGKVTDFLAAFQGGISQKRTKFCYFTTISYGVVPKILSTVTIARKIGEAMTTFYSSNFEVEIDS